LSGSGRRALGPEKCGGRALRARVKALLKADDFPDNLQGLRGSGGEFGLSPRRAVGPLLALLASGEAAVKERAVTALGLLAADLAAQDLEAARDVMRRLMWSLNEESGGIGWGAPAAMAEIMVRHEGLAREYASILVSYMNPEGNYLEHVPLQRDLLRGVGRLADIRPGLLLERGADRLLVPFFSSPDADLRGLAAWCAGRLRARGAREPLQGLLEDPAEIAFSHSGGGTPRARVGTLAREALAALDVPPGGTGNTAGS